MIAAMRRAHQRLAVQATVSGILATAVTLLWAATGGGSFWPKWVWLALAIPMGLHAALFGARQVKSRRARAIATHGAISGVVSGTLILIWAFAGFGFFWPLIPITVLAALLGLHAALAGIFWRPEAEELVERVDELTRTRRGALDVQAHELRRIERDLHDGAQARLVALAMDLGMAEERFDRDPEGARELVEKARDEAKLALAELRDLARGMRPALLAERGLPEAIRALASRTQLPTTVTVEPGARVAPAVESAAYFVVAEALTNAVKHSGAARLSVDVTRDGNLLVVQVGDDGDGGADAEGSGLTGLRKRIEALDGALRIASPPGGPTLLHAEIPCGS